MTPEANNPSPPSAAGTQPPPTMNLKPDPPTDRLTLWHILAGFGWGILVCLLITLLAGCKSIKYVPVETIKTEYVTKTDTLIHKDSIFAHDSIYIHEWQKGDTIYRDRDRWHTIYQDRWRDRTHTDTLIQKDTIQVPYPVEKPLTTWQRFCLDYGKITTGATAALLLLLIAWAIKRFSIKR